MKAAILTELRAPLVLDEITLPGLQYGQVLVKIRYTGLCGSQLGEIDGVKGKDNFLPHLLGHEGGGVVEEVGPGVTRVRPGDRVVLHWRKAQGVQAATPKYTWGSRTVNAGWVTTFNEKAIVSENRVTPVPGDFPLDEASLYGCAVTTGFGVVNNDARVKLGESVVVFGAGGVGMSVILAASLAGAYPIVALDIQPWKLEAALPFGATHVLDAKEPDLDAAVRRIVGREGADVAVDNTGIPRVIESAYELARADGRVILVGVTPHDQKISIQPMPLHFDKVLTGSHGGNVDPSREIPRYIGLQRSGRFSLTSMISHRYPFERINEALQDLRDGKVLRAVVEMEG